MNDFEIRENMLWDEWFEMPETQEIMNMVQSEIERVQRQSEAEPTAETNADNFVLLQTFRVGKINGLRKISSILSVKKAKTEQDMIKHRTQGEQV